MTWRHEEGEEGLLIWALLLRSGINNFRVFLVVYEGGNRGRSRGEVEVGAVSCRNGFLHDGVLYKLYNDRDNNNLPIPKLLFLLLSSVCC